MNVGKIPEIFERQEGWDAAVAIESARSSIARAPPTT
jgi:hypothetical protein